MKLPSQYRYKGTELATILYIKKVSKLMKEYKNNPSPRLAFNLGKEFANLQNLANDYEMKLDDCEMMKLETEFDHYFSSCRRIHKFLAGANFYLFRFFY